MQTGMVHCPICSLKTQLDENSVHAIQQASNFEILKNMQQIDSPYKNLNKDDILKDALFSTGNTPEQHSSNPNDASINCIIQILQSENVKYSQSQIHHEQQLAKINHLQ